MELQNLQKRILITITYFDIFRYPLTALEIYRWFLSMDNEKVSLKEIKENIDTEKIEFQDGFYFLKGKSHLVNQRRQRYVIAEKKYQKALRVINILKTFPYIKMIGIANSLAYSNSDVSSDIDLFIITTKDKIWQARFLVSTYLKVLGLRPKIGDTKDKICTAFYITEDNLNLEKYKSEERDYHFAMWLSQIVPVYDKGIAEQFFAENSWIKKFMPNVYFNAPVLRRRLSSRSLIPSAAILDFILGSWCEKFQLKVLPNTIKEMAGQNNNVIINDKILKFHTNDRRREYNRLIPQ